MHGLIALLLIGVVLAGCRPGRWEYVEEQLCPGGRINVERRTVDTVGDRARNTTVRTNACLN